MRCIGEHFRIPAGKAQLAFTLIELLVVIAILALLAGLLLPALVGAKERAQTAVCLSNLRQLQMAWLAYVTDNSERLPPNATGVQAGRATNEPAWVAGVMTYENQMAATPWFSDSTNTALLLEPGPGRLGPYAGGAGIYHCPADRSYIILSGQPHDRVRSYSMNQYINPMDAITLVPGAVEVYRRMADFKKLRPVDAFVFVHEHEDSLTAARFMMAGPVGWWAAFPTARHSGGGTFSFADGHASSRKWLDARTRVPVRRTYQYGAMQFNNRDIEWVLNHATAP